MRTPHTSRNPHNILTVFKKELRRFFGDRRVVMGLIMPGLIIYLVYSLMGHFLSSALSPDKKAFLVYTENMPESVASLLTDAPLESVGSDDPKEALAAGALDLFVVFPPDFEKLVTSYDPSGGEKAPHVEIFYNSSEPTSTEAYSLFTGVLNQYESLLTNRFDINRDPDTTYDLSTPADFTTMIFSTLMPMLLLVLLFASCLSVAPESIAGEKERGTLATLLVTPLRRKDLAIGKILALSLISLIGGLCSFLGVFFSLPRLMGPEAENMFDTSMYTPADYLAILLVMFSTLLLFISLISVVSALAKSVKEATGYVSPMMLVVVLIGMSGMLRTGKETPTGVFLIPVYNSVQCMAGVFSMNYRLSEIVLTVVSNLLIAAGLSFALTRMFNSEKIMFKK